MTYYLIIITKFSPFLCFLTVRNGLPHKGDIWKSFLEKQSCRSYNKTKLSPQRGVPVVCLYTVSMFSLHRCSHKQQAKSTNVCVCVSALGSKLMLSRIFRLKQFTRTAPSSLSTCGLGRFAARRGGTKLRTRATTAVSSCVMLLLLLCVCLRDNWENLGALREVFNRQECGLN